MSPELPSREEAKRRLMFVPGEDFYFLGYTVLLLLEAFGCRSPERSFQDPQKIAFLADFVGSDADLRLALASAPLTQPARKRLALLFDRALARRAPLERLLSALERASLVSFTRSDEGEEGIYLRTSTSTRALLDASIYEGERMRISQLRRDFKFLRTMTRLTMKERLFGAHGVQTWGD